MGCSVCINEKTVLKCSTGIFDTLYNTFEEIIKNENIKNEQIYQLMEEMNYLNSTMCMYSLNIEEHITNTKSIIILIEILEKTIKKIRTEIADWMLAEILKFHVELIKYKEELESQEK